MNNHHGCQTVVLGQSRYCSITKCPDCSMFHLHIGPLSVRLKSEVFEDVCKTLLDIYGEYRLQENKGDLSVRRH